MRNVLLALLIVATSMMQTSTAKDMPVPFGALPGFSLVASSAWAKCEEEKSDTCRDMVARIMDQYAGHMAKCIHGGGSEACGESALIVRVLSHVLTGNK